MTTARIGNLIKPDCAHIAEATVQSSKRKPMPSTDHNAPLMKNKPLLDNIVEERDLCRNEGANDIADLLDKAAEAINEMWEEHIGYGYAIQTLRQKCGLPTDSTDCQAIWEHIDQLQKQLTALKSKKADASFLDEALNSGDGTYKP